MSNFPGKCIRYFVTCVLVVYWGGFGGDALISVSHWSEGNYILPFYSCPRSLCSPQNPSRPLDCVPSFLMFPVHTPLSSEIGFPTFFCSKNNSNSRGELVLLNLDEFRAPRVVRDGHVEERGYFFANGLVRIWILCEFRRIIWK